MIGDFRDLSIKTSGYTSIKRQDKSALDTSGQETTLPGEVFSRSESMEIARDPRLSVTTEQVSVSNLERQSSKAVKQVVAGSSLAGSLAMVNFSDDVLEQVGKLKADSAPLESMPFISIDNPSPTPGLNPLTGPLAAFAEGAGTSIYNDSIDLPLLPEELQVDQTNLTSGPFIFRTDNPVKDSWGDIQDLAKSHGALPDQPSKKDLADFLSQQKAHLSNEDYQALSASVVRTLGKHENHKGSFGLNPESYSRMTRMFGE